MSSRVTELDRHIAERLKAFREANPDANMAKLAKFIGITYQSYQALEKGEVSFRVSTLERLATFYGVGLEDLIGTEEPKSLPNIGRIAYIIDAVRQMHPDQAKGALESVLAIARDGHGTGRGRNSKVGVNP